MADPRVSYDISVPLRAGTPEWPGDTPYGCGWTLRMADGAAINLSHVTMSPHVGTHADAPLHVDAEGLGSDLLPLEPFHGPAVVVELPDRLRTAASADRALVEFEDIAGQLPYRVERLLLRTGASIAEGRFPDAWPALTPACVARLQKRGLRLLGVDCPSVDARNAKDLATHRALFDGGAYNLENLDLRGVPAGRYELVAYPLRLEGLDAAPVRAVLLGDSR